MRLRHIKGAEDTVKNSPYCIDEYNFNYTLNLNEIFTNNNPIAVELGMGKGKFICDIATKNKNMNFIGIERYATILIKAIENYKKYLFDTKATLNNVEDIIKKTNLRLMYADVKNLDKIFHKESIDTIYLNFSDPWPKKNHINRRLTSTPFLDIYYNILKNGGNIEFKTDNIDLFNFSVDTIKKHKFDITYITYDLHNETDIENTLTEYEENFSKIGNKIYKLISKKL